MILQGGETISFLSNWVQTYWVLCYLLEYFIIYLNHCGKYLQQSCVHVKLMIFFWFYETLNLLINIQKLLFAVVWSLLHSKNKFQCGLYNQRLWITKVQFNVFIDLYYYQTVFFYWQDLFMVICNSFQENIFFSDL